MGKQWFAYLQAHHIRFRLRIKRDMNISRPNGTLEPDLNFCGSLPVSTSCTLYGARLICGQILWVTGLRLPSVDALLIVSDDPCDHVMEEYKRRWKIGFYLQR